MTTHMPTSTHEAGKKTSMCIFHVYRKENMSVCVFYEGVCVCVKVAADDLSVGKRQVGALQGRCVYLCVGLFVYFQSLD